MDQTQGSGNGTNQETVIPVTEREVTEQGFIPLGQSTSLPTIGITTMTTTVNLPEQ